MTYPEALILRALVALLKNSYSHFPSESVRLVNDIERELAQETKAKVVE